MDFFTTECIFKFAFEKPDSQNEWLTGKPESAIGRQAGNKLKFEDMLWDNKVYGYVL